MLYLRRFLKSAVALISVMIVTLTVGCSQNGGPIAAASTGQAVLQGTSEAGDVRGLVNFQDTEEGLVIDASIDEAPSGNHGFHIHEYGSCAEAGDAAGGHYNPDQVQHGYLPEDGFENAHAGDLGNITVDSNGTASYQATLPGLRLTGGQYPIAGRAVIVHANPDDFGQPTGNAGGRIGCGTIVIVPSDAA